MRDLSPNQTAKVWRIWELMAEGTGVSAVELATGQIKPEHAARRYIAMAVIRESYGMGIGRLAGILAESWEAVEFACIVGPNLLSRSYELRQAVVKLKSAGVGLKLPLMWSSCWPDEILPAGELPLSGEVLERVKDVLVWISKCSRQSFRDLWAAPNQRRKETDERRKRRSLMYALVAVAAGGHSDDPAQKQVACILGVNPHVVFRALNEAPANLRSLPDICRLVAQCALELDIRLPQSWNVELPEKAAEVNEVRIERIWQMAAEGMKASPEELKAAKQRSCLYPRRCVALALCCTLPEVTQARLAAYLRVGLSQVQSSGRYASKILEDLPDQRVFVARVRAEMPDIKLPGYWPECRLDEPAKSLGDCIDEIIRMVAEDAGVTPEHLLCAKIKSSLGPHWFVAMGLCFSLPRINMKKLSQDRGLPYYNMLISRERAAEILMDSVELRLLVGRVQDEIPNLVLPDYWPECATLSGSGEASDRLDDPWLHERVDRVLEILANGLFKQLEAVLPAKDDSRFESSWIRAIALGVAFLAVTQGDNALKVGAEWWLAKKFHIDVPMVRYALEMTPEFIGASSKGLQRVVLAAIDEFELVLPEEWEEYW